MERLRGISLDIRAGEILGIAGVAGNGQSQLLEILGGYPEKGAKVRGEVRMNGAALPLSGRGLRCRPAAARGRRPYPRGPAGRGADHGFHGLGKRGLRLAGRARVPEERLLMDNDAIRRDAQAKMERFDVRPRDCHLAARNFSGGNQQKIVVAREIERNPDLLLIGQPTRGVDIGAIEFIHKQIVALRDAGKAILLVSVELDEILALSDRIAVMFDGRIMGER